MLYSAKLQSVKTVRNIFRHLRPQKGYFFSHFFKDTIGYISEKNENQGGNLLKMKKLEQT